MTEEAADIRFAVDEVDAEHSSAEAVVEKALRDAVCRRRSESRIVCRPDFGMRRKIFRKIQRIGG